MPKLHETEPKKSRRVVERMGGQAREGEQDIERGAMAMTGQTVSS